MQISGPCFSLYSPLHAPVVDVCDKKVLLVSSAFSWALLLTCVLIADSWRGPIAAGRKVQHLASAGGQPVSADAWTTAQTGTHKIQNLGAEVGVNFLYSAPCSHKTEMANWQAPLPWSFCLNLSNMVMPSWGGGSALSYQVSPSLWNDAAESGGLEIRWTLKHGVFHCIYGHSLKQVDFSKSGVRRVLVRLYWFVLFFHFCIFYYSFTPHPKSTRQVPVHGIGLQTEKYPSLPIFTRNRILL